MQLRDRFKRGVDTARFKADQLMRVNRVQTESDQLRRQIANLRQNIADAALELHKAGNLQQQALLDLCRAVEELHAQIAAKDVQIANIRAETLEGTPFLEASRHQCPHCRFDLPSGAEFCSNCGRPVLQPIASADTQTQKCANCGALISANAEFCQNCGKPILKTNATDTADRPDTTHPED